MQEYVTTAKLVHVDFRGDVADSIFLAYSLCVPVLLTRDDRIGKYQIHSVNQYVGFACPYCNDPTTTQTPGFGRYFPSSYQSLLNGTNTASLIQHFLKLCRHCPTPVRNIMTQLCIKETTSSANHSKTASSSSSSNTVRPRYGSRKRFYTHVWNTLRSIDPQLLSLMVPNETSTQLETPQSSINLTKEQDELFCHMIDLSDIVQIADRYLVPDTSLWTMAQMKICTVTKEDQIGRCKDHAIGFVGLCCSHCHGQAGKPGYGRYFPSSLRSLAQAEPQMTNHLLYKCKNCPQPNKDLWPALLQNSEPHDLSRRHSLAATQPTTTIAPETEMEMTLTALTPLNHNLIDTTPNDVTTSATTTKTTKMNQYGSRRMFFRRVWTRLHGATCAEIGDSTMLQIVTTQTTSHANEISDDNTIVGTVVEKKSALHEEGEASIPWDRVIGSNNRIVNLDTDRGLISDAQLSAMAQMDICYLTEADRIGWFKDRPIGSRGLCCKHCRGRPSFGRYFPNSVRSLAQTTSTQTIMSHIALYCPQCPPDIRDMIVQRHRLENNNIASKAPTPSSYGSRKVFFDRVWARIHSQPQTDITIVMPFMDEAVTVTTESIDNETPATISVDNVAPDAPPDTTTVDVLTTTPSITDPEAAGIDEIEGSRKRQLHSHLGVDEASKGGPSKCHSNNKHAKKS